MRAAEQVYGNDDHVVYKHEHRKCWLGPGKVVFQDRKIVFIGHIGVFVRVSPNRLCKLNNIFFDNETDDKDNLINVDTDAEMKKGIRTNHLRL